MANPTGELKVKAKGKTYRLHLGFSVIAELQEDFGDRVEAVLTPPDPKEGEESKLPDLKVMHAVFLGALQRYHADVADRWLVDDILAENENVFGKLLVASAPGRRSYAKGKEESGGLDLAQWCEAYVAAGLPPERFWTLTPRLYSIEMDGAMSRIRRERVMTWEGAMLSRMQDPPSLAKYLGEQAAKEPAQFLDMRLRASTKGLRSMTMEEYRRARVH